MSNDPIAQYNHGLLLSEALECALFRVWAFEGWTPKELSEEIQSAFCSALNADECDEIAAQVLNDTRRTGE